MVCAILINKVTVNVTEIFTFSDTHSIYFCLHCLALANLFAIKLCSLKQLSLTDDCCFALVYFVFSGYYILNVLALVSPDKISVQF